MYSDDDHLFTELVKHMRDTPDPVQRRSVREGLTGLSVNFCGPLSVVDLAEGSNITTGTKETTPF